MGYYTHLNGEVDLDKEVSDELAAEFKQYLIDKIDEWAELHIVNGVKLYWDEETRKRYNFPSEIKTACEWLRSRGINANGDIFWSGEESDDLGVYRIRNSVLQIRAVEISYPKWQGELPEPAIPTDPETLKWQNWGVEHGVAAFSVDELESYIEARKRLEESYIEARKRLEP